MTFWDKIKNVMGRKELLSRAEIGKDLWMITRMLSMDPGLLPQVALANQHFFRLRPEEYYSLLCHLLPSSPKFLRYVKRPPKDPIHPRVKAKLAERLVCSQTQLREVLQVLWALGYEKADLERAVGAQRGKKKAKPA